MWYGDTTGDRLTRVPVGSRHCLGEASPVFPLCAMRGQSVMQAVLGRFWMHRALK